MRNFMVVTALSALLMTGAALPAHAQDAASAPPTTVAPADTDGDSGAADSDRAAAMEKFNSMSPEQKEQMRAQLKQKFDSMSPEDKAAMRDKLKSQFANMTPEEKEQIKAKIQERMKNLSPEQKQKIQEMMQNRRGGGASGDGGDMRSRFQRFRQSHGAAGNGDSDGATGDQ